MILLFEVSMPIYTVQPGDTIYTVAEKYNIPITRLLYQNIIQPNQDLIVGQNLVITYPDKVYNVQKGDTLQSIADKFGVSDLQLLQNNPHFTDRDYFYIGEEVIISYPNDREEIEVNGYAFSYINVDILKKTLPLLTYLSILDYQITETGDIIVPDDLNIVTIARGYGVEPLMMCATSTIQGQENYEITHVLLNHDDIQNNYIKNLIQILQQNNLSGINIGFQYILEEDMQKYIDFIAHIKNLLQDQGYIVIVTCIPSTFDFNPEGKNETTFFYQIGQIADRVILISYLWTYASITYVEQTTVKFLEKYVQYAVTQIPSKKILVGITRVAYDWELPYVKDKSHINLLTNTSALNLAYAVGVDLLFDEETQTPYFYYKTDGTEHFVWFKDPKTIKSILDLIDKYNLGGISVWSIMDYGPATWAYINSQKKLL
jgi:spore germination protein